MGAVPKSIKSEIITKYLEGLSNLEIQRLLNVSIGTISAVTARAARKDNSVSYMRDIARKVYKKNLLLDDVISGERPYNKIKEVGLTSSFFESFLDSTNKESYRLEIELDKFLTKIIGMLQFERQYEINLQYIPDYIKKGKEEIDKMNDEFSRNYQSLYAK
jgi:hypothetical protein